MTRPILKEWILIGIKVEKERIMQKDPAGTRRMLSRAGERRNRDVFEPPGSHAFPIHAFVLSVPVLKRSSITSATQQL